MITRAHPELIAATRPVIETLEGRRLLAGDAATVFALPYELDFNKTSGGIVDKDGQSTGFTYVQPNRAGNEYQPHLIDLSPGEGLLKITSSGSASAGGNFGTDDTLTNGVQMQFYAGKAWTISTRLKGPLGYLDKPAEQGGLLFGPDSDNYVKLVAASTPEGPRIQFIDEQETSFGFQRNLGPSGSLTDIGSFARVQTLDLIMSGDPATRTIRAYYRINGGALVKIDAELTLNARKGAWFFGEQGRAGLIAMHKNNEGPVTVAFDRFEAKRGGPGISRPDITATRPANGAVNVMRDGFVAADVFLPNPGAGINPNSLSSRTVKLYRTSDGLEVPATLNTSAAGDALVLQPMSPLAANTKYTFAVTSGLTDTTGHAFLPYTATFTTGTSLGADESGVSFDKVSLSTAKGQSFASVAIGPDNRLYATTLTGHIFRYDINADGTLAEPLVVNTVRQRNGGARFITGLDFDPTSDPANPTVWITHGQAVYENASDYTGKISRLFGPNLQYYNDMVVGLPRSIRDHLTNQLKFGPGGKLYFTQGSNSALGAPDNAWGLREEHVLNGAVLVADPRALSRRVGNNEGPLDVSGSYDPFSPTAPLAIYASGVRNAYDLVWHSNGQLYVPGNGSAAGGRTPATPAAPFSNTNRIDYGTNGPYTGPEVAGIDRVTEAQADYLFRVEYGGYYGHPNPSRSEYVLNGGNPTSGVDANEVPGYPVGTLPDRNYRGSAFNFGKNLSPNGILEYRGDAFGGKLQGQLLVARYSGGDDVVALDVDAQGNITGQTSINGLSGLIDPLDLVEDRRNGNLYVVEHGAARITLMRPGVTSGAPDLTVNTSRRYYNDVRGGDSSEPQFFRITNGGNDELVIPAGGITLSGTHADQFEFTSRPSAQVTLAPGQSLGIGVAFDPTSGTSIGIKDARVNIASNDPDTPVRQLRVRGFAMGGLGGSNEPSLQRILELNNLPIVVGDSDPSTVALDNPPASPNDEVAMQQLVKAGPGPVTIEPMAVFGLESNPALEFGYYEPGTPTERHRLFTIATSDFQSVNPTARGATAFDPGSAAFGFYAVWPGKKNPDGTSREGFTEDQLNGWEPDPSLRHKVRFYPLKNPDGSVVANAFIMAHEEAEGAGDNQDFVAVVRNVAAAPDGAELGLTNLSGAPYADRMVFNKIGKLNTRIPNEVNNYSKLRVRNTGTSNLLISSLLVTGRFELVNPPAAGTIVAPGAFVDVGVRFTANRGSSHSGTLVIHTNDVDEAQKVVQLYGFWQTESEGANEPTLPLIGQMLGYATVFAYDGQTLNTNGLNSAIGDEVLSEYWKRADVHQPVTVRQLAAFHTQGEKTTVSWHRKGSNSPSTLFTHERVDGQRLFPRDDVSAEPAVGRFNPGSNTFGFLIDDAWSDHTKNPQEQPGGNYGHSIRFYPARDRNGEFIPNTWLMVMDYFGVNYDYNDNVYLVSNMRPEVGAPTPDGVAAYQDAAGVRIDWADNTNDDLLGYHVFRSSNPNGGFKRINGEPITTSEYLDESITNGAKMYYRVMAVTTSGTTSYLASAATAGPG